MEKSFSDAVDEILRNDKTFARGAYFFIREALAATVKKHRSNEEKNAAAGIPNIKKNDAEEKQHHVSGRELLNGLREFALEQYGPMAATLFNDWGIYQTPQFGEIVFKLVQTGIFGATEKDTPEDFKHGFDFREAFVMPYLPRAKMAPAAPPEKMTPVKKTAAKRKPKKNDTAPEDPGEKNKK